MTELERYGKVLSQRELIAVAMLAALGWERQLESHVRGALNLKVDHQELLNIVPVI